MTGAEIGVIVSALGAVAVAVGKGAAWIAKAYKSTRDDELRMHREIADRTLAQQAEALKVQAQLLVAIGEMKTDLAAKIEQGTRVKVEVLERLDGDVRGLKEAIVPPKKGKP